MDKVADRPDFDRADTSKPFEYKIVDADAHVNPPHDFWADYLPAKFKDAAP
jgi:hypothetical protein